MTDEAIWPAPVAVDPVDATITVPGSKSITNRALILAALADEPGTIRRPLDARDTDLMVTGLRALGVKVRKNGTRGWTVTPGRLRGGKSIDVGNAGTVMRFLPPLAALAEGDVSFHGDERASQRPIGPVLDALRAVGVSITGDAVPCTVHGRGSVTGGQVVLDASTSSQFVSALLLAGAKFDDGIVVVHDGPPVPSQPHIDMTVAMLRDVGVEVDTSTPQRWAVAAGSIEGRDLDVEPDLSNAAPFLAAAMVTGGTVVIPGWPKRTTQAGDALRHLFADMGGSCTLGSEGLTARGPEELLGIDVDLHDVGELAPVVAAVCARATSPSTLRGIAHLRLHETDRLAALARELTALGANVGELDDGLSIDPAPLHGGTFRTYDDHRLATAAAVLGLVVPGIHVENIETTAKTMPEFVELWRNMLEGR